MKEYLKKLKLVDNSSIKIDMRRSEFINNLNQIVDDGNTSIFSDTLDVFSQSKNEFKGKVDYHGFKIKRKRKFFDPYMNLSTASGSFTDHNNGLLIEIEIEINGFSISMIIFYISAILVYPIIIFGILSSDNVGTHFSIPFILIQSVFVLIFPYLLMRRSVKRMKYELERELYYLTKIS